MRNAVYCALALVLAVVSAAPPAMAQTAAPAASPTASPVYRADDALGALLAKTKSLSQSGNAGGKNILENSCLYKDSFSMSASEPFLDRCDVSQASGQFIAKYGPPNQTGQAPGGKTVLEYFLTYKENDYHVKIFLGCADQKTETFAIVECIHEKNRFMPGGPPKGPGRHGGPRP